MSNRACEKEMKGEMERKIPLSVSLRPRDGEIETERWRESLG